MFMPVRKCLHCGTRHRQGVARTAVLRLAQRMCDLMHHLLVLEAAAVSGHLRCHRRTGIATLQQAGRATCSL